MAKPFEKTYTAFFQYDAMGASGPPYPDRATAEKEAEEDEEIIGVDEANTTLLVKPLSPDPDDVACEVTGKLGIVGVRIDDPYNEGCGFVLSEEVARDLHEALGRVLAEHTGEGKIHHVNCPRCGGEFEYEEGA